MKKFLLGMVVALSFLGDLNAQEVFSFEKLFDGRYSKQENAIEVLIKGKKLKPFHLTLFRSLTLKVSSKEAKDIELLILRDGLNAIDKDVGKVGGRLYYAFYRFPEKENVYRYLFFKNGCLKSKTNSELIVIYMEGHATLDELKQMFQ